MTHEQILDKLKIDTEYYGEFGKKYLSQSDIYTLINEPHMYHVEKLETAENVKNFEVGKYFHYLMLEPDKAKEYEIVDIKSRRSKAFQEAWDNNKKSLTLEESELAQRLATSMQTNDFFSSYIYNKENKIEEPGLIKINDTEWKGKADIITPEYVIDLKTTSDIHRFKYSFYSYFYSAQAWLYQQIFNKPVIFLVACKKTGLLGKFTIDSDKAKEHGENSVLKAIDNYNTYCSAEAMLNNKIYHVEHTL